MTSRCPRKSDALQVVDTYIVSLYLLKGYSSNLSFVGGDDLEPGYDSNYNQSVNAVRGFEATTGAYMYNDGSPDPGYWTNLQLYNVLYGFPTSYPFTQVYTNAMATNWETLATWSVASGGRGLIRWTGVLASYPNGNDLSPAASYTAMENALNSKSSTAQTIPYLSNI